MAFVNKFKQLLGNGLDRVGTALHLPELGLSEYAARGATTNTGKQQLNTNLAPEFGEVAYNKANYGMSVPGNLDAHYASPEVQNYLAKEQLGAAKAAAEGQLGGTTRTTGYQNFGGEGANTGAIATGNSGSSDGGSSAAPVEAVQPDLTFYGGKWYDKNNAGERLAYLTRRTQDGDEAASAQLGQAEEEYRRALAASATTQETSAKELDRRMGDVNSREATYAKDFDKRVTQFGDDNRIGSANRQNAFAAMGVNTFQSAQGDEQIASDKKYQEGLTSLSDEAATNAKGFAGSRDSITSDKTKLVNGYDTYLTDTAKALSDNKTKIAQNTNQFKEGLVSDLAPFDVKDGITNFGDRYNLSEYNPNQTTTADLSKFTPYTSFGTLNGQAGVTASNPFANLSGVEDPTSTYIGGRDQKRDKDPLKQYLYAKA